MKSLQKSIFAETYEIARICYIVDEVKTAGSSVSPEQTHKLDYDSVKKKQEGDRDRNRAIEGDSKFHRMQNVKESALVITSRHAENAEVDISAINVHFTKQYANRKATLPKYANRRKHKSPPNNTINSATERVVVYQLSKVHEINAINPLQQILNILIDGCDIQIELNGPVLFM